MHASTTARCGTKIRGVDAGAPIASVPRRPASASKTFLTVYFLIMVPLFLLALLAVRGLPALIAAGLLSVVIFPATSLALVRPSATPPTPPVREETPLVAM